MKYISIFSAMFLMALFFFTWGFVSAEYEKFPWSAIDPVQKQIAAVLEGGEARNKALKRLKHEVGFRPEKMIGKFEKNKKRNYRTVDIKGLRKRRKSEPLLFSGQNDAVPEGYFIIWGAFDFEDDLYGAILMDHKGNVINKWIPDREALREMKCGKNRVVQDTEVEIDYEKPDDLPQGFEVFPDGSVLFNDGDPGNGMQKLDFDSNPVWVRPGKFNHCIADQKGGRGVWTIESDHILRRVNTESGESMEKIRIMEIMHSNPDTDVLSLRYDDLDKKWLNDRWHFNDADPLPEEYEDEFSEFEAGDLLLSSRSLNAVMVVEPESKKIKWLKTGSFSRQHDPDWQKNGTITVYDNQTRDVFGGKKPGDSPRFSRILQIDPDSGETRVVYDGQKDRFYSRIRGKHQILPDGSILITSSEQGRVMAVNQEGETIFEFINSYGNGEVLFVSEAVWVPRDFFDFDPEKSKES